MTVGKKIGVISFFISETLVFIVLILVYFSGDFHADIINMILLFQGTIFSVVWGAKASSNFAKKDHDRGAG